MFDKLKSFINKFEKTEEQRYEIFKKKNGFYNDNKSVFEKVVTLPNNIYISRSLGRHVSQTWEKLIDCHCDSTCILEDSCFSVGILLGSGFHARFVNDLIREAYEDVCRMRITRNGGTLN